MELKTQIVKEKMKMKTNKFIESGIQHTFVIYIFINFFSIQILNIYLIKNLFFSIIISFLILTIYHFLIGYRFYKEIFFSYVSMNVNYPFKFFNNTEIVFLYEDISKVKVAWGHGGNQSFIKFFVGKESVKFISRKWDIENIVMILNKHCNKGIFDINACEIINDLEKKGDNLESN